MSDVDLAGQGAPAGLGNDDPGDIKVKRSGGRIAMGIVFALLLLGAGGAGIWYAFLREDPAVAHETFRREIFGTTHLRYYQAFWQCALAAPADNFRNNEALVAKIMQNSSGRDAARYAEHLQKSERCLPLLAEAIPEYRAMKTNPATPDDYGPLLDELAEDVERIQKAWTDFAVYQGGAEKRANLRERIELRGKAYAGYEGAVEENDAARRSKYQANAVSYYNFVKCALGQTSYTSFQGTPDGDDAAHYKLVAHLDQQCTSSRDEFALKLQETCSEHLFPSAPPQPSPEFETAVQHWVKQGGDYGSAVPLKDCLEEYEQARTKELVDNIAKSWYGYRSTYREIFNISKSKTTTIFDRGRGGASGQPESGGAGRGGAPEGEGAGGGGGEAAE